MAGKVVAAQPIPSFEYELFEDDPDNPRTVVVSSNPSTPWIEPWKLKLRHRIGRGPFGDVWLATLHQLTVEYDEYHEVAVKMFHLIREDHVKVLLDKFDELFPKCQGIDGVCALRGVSIIKGKIAAVMKFYEGSVGDKLGHVKGGKLTLPEVLRYGIKLALGVLELHKKEVLVLNLKPCNFLLDENDHAVVGDIGIPYLLRGIAQPSSDMSLRLGTPNYMAPEQWQPEIRGPISFETDSWGFACSMVEMLTGVQPWCGRSADEIHDLVVTRQQRPHIPEGLPFPIEDILRGCFDHDLRNRPLMKDILRAFKSVQTMDHGDEGWMEPGTKTITDKPSYTKWILSKDHLQMVDRVRSRKPRNSYKLENMDIPDGVVVGLEDGRDRNGFVLVRVLGIHDPLRVPVATLERVSSGLAAGDCVRLKEEDKKQSPVGILHSIDRKGRVAVGFIGVETLWKGSSSQLQMSESYFEGQFVKLKPNVFSPRFEWPCRSGGSRATGKIWRVLPNGCLLVKFRGRLNFGQEHDTFLADPAEVEVVSFNTCEGLVKKYQHLEDFHWAIRPLLVAIGLLTAQRVGLFVAHQVSKPKTKKQQHSSVHSETSRVDGRANSLAAWLPPPVANMLGVSNSPR